MDNEDLQRVLNVIASALAGLAMGIGIHIWIVAVAENWQEVAGRSCAAALIALVLILPILNEFAE